MKKTLKILLSMTVIASLFAVGFAGNAAAVADDNQVQLSGQAAVSNVDQSQAVAQGNYNHQEDNVALSGAISVNPSDGDNGYDSGEAESGDAIAVQASAQSNENVQAAWSNAQNWNAQNQDD
ncbi:hypothetical protein ZOD2009_07314 [Haladaptatus paucihalophilus DX253]|uniref:Uncharacterized protein n=3 Tax=Haladaptatus TaxID=367188 RepID=E7QRP0_HALPU|nr:hypothetical protein [Haladaptatus paucihalophilus]EFW92659.1 hypothetical protein ZOD2009_07314 [Haladaptatus paucihalophilus DX253]ODR80767.1 hypothetical protein BG842_10710 [Haladaptatus sp. W1]GKZ13742.1 hypothetical protein HAL_16230 [Haladaptatus sp. T7]SHK16501.1 hypothetical protein SAMN05444342_0797 [Haladaptatus paucihalophilus DX253]